MAEIDKIKVNNVTYDIAGTRSSVDDTTLKITRFASASPSMDNIINAIYPIGSIYISTNGINPQTYISGTTWEIFGSGKTIIGVDTSDTDFNTVEETGGSKTHNHSHNTGSTGTQNKSFAKFTQSTGNKRLMMREVNLTNAESYSENSRTTISGTWSAQTTSTNSYGVELGGVTDNGDNLPPYITVYMWKRTA